MRVMVKIGSHVGSKPEKGQSGEEGLECSPLLMPLDVSQLQQPVPDKVVVKTTTEYQLQQKKKKKTCVPGIKKLNINLYDEVSEKVKLMGLVLVTMAFLACLLLLVMYKALWYEQLACPQGFVFKHKHCTPEPLEAYYPQPESGPRGRLYAAISHLSQAEKAVPKLLPSSWLPVINALKGAKKIKVESGHAHQKGSSDTARHQRD
ncbi:neuron-specific protein family member 1-like [Scleropages formosus]|uniref:Neuron-specific protein family member 1-like n=1 Tax=Scleropages formosus TaxID=113540 RepID=A0A0P7X290_SCLFO|nr:neuron-specific protein family member 1-like [Scleropages formosus]